ncbi:uncharacterized protein [Drosophila bipectinata]|uniref:uncharacterized protein n=1 Tax=Drosophila bipectinata TaxID=42026 RepID=UPI001C897FBF|nr:uncharacterized protein LOC108123377 [Drosophila bipectinata]
MWNLKRGLAAAATCRFPRFVPKINDLSQISSHAPFYPPTPPSTQYAGSAGAKRQCRNYLNLTRDQPELAKLYDRVCKTDHRPALKVNFLRKCDLDRNHENPRQKSGRTTMISSKSSVFSNESKNPIHKSSVSSNQKSSVFSNASKNSIRKSSMFSNASKSSVLRNSKSGQIKKNKSKLKIPGPETLSMDSSDLYFANPPRFKLLAKRLMAFGLGMRKAASDIPKTPSPYINVLKSPITVSPDLEPYFSPNESPEGVRKVESQQWEDKWDDWQPIVQSKSLPKSQSKSQFSSNVSDNSKPELEALVSIYSYNFDPIDVKNHRKEFTHFYSPEFTDFEESGPKSWPTLEPKKVEPRSKIRKVSKPRDRRLARKLLRRKFSKAVSCQTDISSKVFYKYHTYVCKMPSRFGKSRKGKRRRFRRAVACQTERLWKNCVLCHQLREDEEPEKPFLIEMRKRQARDELQQYYLRMNRSKFLPSFNPTPEKSSPSVKSVELKASSEDIELPLPKPQKNSKKLLQKMQLELHQCLAVLALCDHIVDEQLRRCRAENESDFRAESRGS